jgi:dephospho-CoA kinase
MPQAEKVKRADYVIDTSGAVEETGVRVKEIVEEMTR